MKTANEARQRIQMNSKQLIFLHAKELKSVY